MDTADSTWRGCPATINPSLGDHVWGAVWTIQSDQLPNLDKQEGVDENIYKPLEVEVQSKEGEKFHCRTYQLVDMKHSDKRPSPQYCDVILRGAKQCNLPEEYIKKLNAIETNGYSGRVEIHERVLKLIETNTSPEQQH